MTLLCIIISVFLVTAIFSLADMMIRAETAFMISGHGNWHISLKNISQENADEINNRPDVTAVGSALVFNFDGGQPYRVNEKRAVLYGTDETYMNQIYNGITEGISPKMTTKLCLALMQQPLLGCSLGIE